MGGAGEVVRVAPLPTLVPRPEGLADLLFALASIVAEGGTIGDARAADFLFSSDASHPDTLRYLKATWPCLSHHQEPGAGGGNRSPRINRDDQNSLERSKFSVLRRGDENR